MIQIDEKPDRPVCSIHGPLRWGYYTDTKQGARWVATWIEIVPGLGVVMVPHTCDSPDRPPARWQPDPIVAERAHRGRALVNAVLSGDNPFDDKEAGRE